MFKKINFFIIIIKVPINHAMISGQLRFRTFRCQDLYSTVYGILM